MRIPDAQHQIGLSSGVLGAALLALALGSLPAMPLTGLLAARFGSRPVATLTSLAFCAGVMLPLLAPTLPLFVVSLVVFGIAMGSMDVAMNI